MDKVSVPADVCSSVPVTPMSPEPEARFTVVAVSVKLPEREICPAPLAERISVLAVKLVSTFIVPLPVVETSSVLEAPTVKELKFTEPVSRI